ncbi:MAG: DNA repair protein RecN [Sphingomonadales bacterium]|nr:MAG: DNA repair protein RecN [Sphingomonadales bacterium]
MLTALSIANIVLIERLDLDFEAGLGVLTGETGAGKSILLDALGLALGARADSALVRQGTDKAQVTASFVAPASGTKLAALLAENEIALESGEPLLIRRTLKADGGSRAFLNDQPCSAALLREVGTYLVEIHGQHDDRGLLAPAGHRALLDAYARADTRVVATAHAAWRAAEDRLAAARAAISEAERDREWLEHCVTELQTLAPQPGEDAELSEARATMQKGEKVAGDLGAIMEAFEGSDSGPAQLRGAARRLDRLAGDHPLLAEALAGLDRAIIEADEAESKLHEAARAMQYDPDRLEATETRLFELRAMARKHGVQPDELAEFTGTLAARLDAIEGGSADTIIFDEIDRGVGGAVASAIGERLARLAGAGKQLLAVTHSPQVAAKGAAHFIIAKSSEGTVTRTSVHALDEAGRREEIARMLSGAEVTAEARAQAERLLEPL